MYIDLVVLLVLMLIVWLFFKRFSSFVFFMIFVDTFLRVLTFIKDNCGVADISKLIGKYVPKSIFDIIDKYTRDIDILNISLKWLFVGILIIFLFYAGKIILKNKKI